MKEILTSLKGIGDIIAAILMTKTPELKKTGKQSDLKNYRFCSAQL